MNLSEISPLAGYLKTFFENDPDPYFLITFAVVLVAVFSLSFLAVVVAYMDRKIGADIQMRIGPNRVGPGGMFQFVADGVKAFFKQDNIPLLAKRWFFQFGPVLAIISVFLAASPLPFATQWSLSNLEWGVFYSLVMMCFVQFFLFLGGYSSSSHWSVLGSFRVLVVQLAFVVPSFFAILAVVLVSGGASFSKILSIQGGLPWEWTAFRYPTTLFSIFSAYVSFYIWQMRSPFDLAYSNVDLFSGVGAEYSGLRSGLLDYLRNVQAVLGNALLVALFFGGFHFPVSLESLGRAASIVEWLFFVLKIFVLSFFSNWIRWSVPRLCMEQFVFLSWKVLLPSSILGLVTTAIWMVVFNGKGVL